MIYLAANHASVWLLRFGQNLDMGWCMSPKGWRRPSRLGQRMPYALDNGRYHPPDAPPPKPKTIADFYTLLHKASRYHPPLFVVVPDQPYDAERTLDLAREHGPRLKAWYPWCRLALAVQDGMEPWHLDGWDAMFLAGSDAFKDGRLAEFVEAARSRGMWAHVARVNGLPRLRACMKAGVHSVDGTCIGRGDARQWGQILTAMRGAP